jgi:hypothetical protein
MKRIILILLLYIFYELSSILFAQNGLDSLVQINIDDPSQYLPNYIENIYIGMPLADFENVKDTTMLDLDDNDSNLWVQIHEDVNDEGIDEIVYKFDKEECGVNIERPLYQINIKYLVLDDEVDYINEKFGEPFIQNNPNSKEWLFRTNKDYLLIIKESDETVQIIATMAGTEWDPKK